VIGDGCRIGAGATVREALLLAGAEVAPGAVAEAGVVSPPESPYANLERRAFWRTGVAEYAPPALPDLYRKRFEIGPEERIATAGSCFAQHVSRSLVEHGYRTIDAEPPPPGLDRARARAYGYRLYSARYGNLYTARQLLQLLREATGEHEPEGWIWERDGRYFDALRPAVEPHGLGSPEEVRAHRAVHLGAVRRLIEQVDVLVFTFGLTEAWVHTESGTVFPTAPGTLAGRFDPERFKLANFGFEQVHGDFAAALALLRRFRPGLKAILAVSPVPLTATAGGEHALTANTYSKSVLRAVAGQLYAEDPAVDYFPSYELVASHWSRASGFDDNLRTVSAAGLAAVMGPFFAEHSLAGDGAAAPIADRASTDADLDGGAADPDEDEICEDALLDAFAR
jgi:hypothetical protein